MTKRADGKFERQLDDFYPTPEAAVPFLQPHIAPATKYVEPCAGDGALINHLWHHLHIICAKAIDTTPRDKSVELGNALLLSRRHVLGADLIITNPPYDRAVMHPIINRCRQLLPSWFLLEADWLFTKQAADLLAYADKIVAVGRLKLIADSKTSGFDNYCWVRFGNTITSTRFFPREG